MIPDLSLIRTVPLGCITPLRLVDGRKNCMVGKIKKRCESLIMGRGLIVKDYFLFSQRSSGQVGCKIMAQAFRMNVGFPERL